MNFFYCLCILFVIGNYTDILSGVLGVDFYRKNLPWGGKFLGVNVPGEMLHRGELLMKFFLIVLLSLCQIFHVGVFQGNYSGTFFRVFYFR